MKTNEVVVTITSTKGTRLRSIRVLTDGVAPEDYFVSSITTALGRMSGFGTLTVQNEDKKNPKR